MTSEITPEMSFLSTLSCNKLKASQSWPEKIPLIKRPPSYWNFWKQKGTHGVNCPCLTKRPVEWGVKNLKAKQKYNLELPKEVKFQQANNATLSLGIWKYLMLRGTELHQRMLYPSNIWGCLTRCSAIALAQNSSSPSHPPEHHIWILEIHPLPPVLSGKSFQHWNSWPFAEVPFGDCPNPF